MTPEQTIEIRRSLAAAATRAKNAHGANPRHPAIQDALDPEILSDELFQVAKNPPNDLGLGNIPNIKFLTSLCDFREYYESGNGNNWNNFQLNNYNPYLYHIYQENEGVSGDRIHAECWILAAVNHGHCSDLTDGIRFLLNELRAGFGDDEFKTAMERLEQLPNKPKGQIAAARLYPVAFKAVLNTLLTGEGEGWLAIIAQNPVACEVRQPKWGVWVNGNQTDIALCVVTTQQVLEFSQIGHRISKKCRGGRVIVKMTELYRENFDLADPIRVANHDIAVPQFDRIIMARRYVNEVFCEFIDRNAEEAISAANLWALAPRENVQFCLGGTPANILQRRNIMCGDLRLYLYRINLRGINGYQESALTADGVPLVQIGPIPAIEIGGADPVVASFNEKDTLFVFGQRTRISIAAVDQNQINWNASGGGIVQKRQGEWELSCDQYSWGNRIIISTEIAGRRVSQPVRFLPPDMLEAMLQGTEWSNGNGLLWTPDRSDVDIRREIENTEMVSGMLQMGGSNVKIWHPSAKPHHWFNEGLYDATVRDFDVISEIAPNQVAQPNPPQLHIYIPAGRHKLLSGGTDWLVDLEGPGYRREKIEHCPEWFDRKDDEVVLLNIDTGARHGIARFNDRPPPMTNLLPHSTLESIEQLCERQYTISDIQDKLRSMVVGGEPIAASSNWTGTALTEKLRLLQNRYTIAPDGTPYNPIRSVTLPQLRKVHPLLDGLATIHGSNRPDWVWMPISAFRIAPTNMAYGYHPLRTLVNGNISLGDINCNRIYASFNYGRKTSFTPCAEDTFPLKWIIRNNDVALLELQNLRDTSIALGDLPADLINGYFRGAMAWADKLIGQKDEYHLGGLFPEVCERFVTNPARRFIFQTAVLCRLRAWHGIAPGSVDRRIQAEVLRQQLAMICWRISQVPEANEIFISDVLTVEWAIAWFNKFNP